MNKNIEYKLNFIKVKNKQKKNRMNCTMLNFLYLSLNSLKC